MAYNPARIRNYAHCEYVRRADHWGKSSRCSGHTIGKDQNMTSTEFNTLVSGSRVKYGNKVYTVSSCEAYKKSPTVRDVCTVELSYGGRYVGSIKPNDPILPDLQLWEFGTDGIDYDYND